MSFCVSQTQLMQYAIGFSSFADFLENDPSNASLLDAEDGRVSDGLLLWAHKQIQLGMDASVLVHVLEDWGLDIQVPSYPTLASCHTAQETI